jgi:hypothetical protein
MSQSQNSIEQKFHSGFRWTLAGSIVFEILKTSHNLLLLHMLPALYGFIGSSFAIFYFVARIADFGATNSLSPFYRLFTQNKHSFRNKFLKLYLLPTLAPLTLLTVGAIWFYSKNFPTAPRILALVLIPALIISETIRMFLRQFLHLAFKNRTVISIEFSTFSVYLLVLWLPVLATGTPPVLNAVFMFFLAESIIANTIFIATAKRLYRSIPDETPTDETSAAGDRAATGKMQQALWRKTFKVRVYNFFLRVSRDIFTMNVLTPLFAIRFGLKQAGLFYMAGTLATSLQSIVKATIGYSGGALLANLKNQSLGVQANAFRLLSKKLIYVILPIICIIAANHKAIIKLSQTHSTTSIVAAFSLIYFFITFTEFFFILYEQFYILQEASRKLFMLKAFEFLMFYSMVSTLHGTSPIPILFGVIVIRIISLMIVGINGYYEWKIALDFRIRWPVLLICVLFAALSFFIIEILFGNVLI